VADDVRVVTGWDVVDIVRGELECRAVPQSNPEPPREHDPNVMSLAPLATHPRPDMRRPSPARFQPLAAYGQVVQLDLPLRDAVDFHRAVRVTKTLEVRRRHRHKPTCRAVDGPRSTGRRRWIDGRAVDADVRGAKRSVGVVRDKGITLEDYDQPGLKAERGIATLPGARALWFKEPDRNILSVFVRG
jgi:hypothetical protein